MRRLAFAGDGVFSGRRNSWPPGIGLKPKTQYKEGTQLKSRYYPVRVKQPADTDRTTTPPAGEPLTDSTGSTARGAFMSKIDRATNRALQLNAGVKR